MSGGLLLVSQDNVWTTHAELARPCSIELTVVLVLEVGPGIWSQPQEVEG